MTEKKEFIRYIGKNDNLADIDEFSDLRHFLFGFTEDINAAVSWHEDQLPAKKVRITVEVVE